MKTARRIATLLICLSLCLSLGAAGFALETADPELDLADAMHGLGLFMGVGENEDGTVNYDLDRAPTRIEALVMLIRLLGKESEAMKLGKTHSFTDVLEWADGYVSYAVENGLTNGVSDTRFDCASEVAPVMYMTFLLRALGYSDEQNGDFVWNEPYALADMLSFGTLAERITRADAMKMSAQALYANPNGGTTPLYEKLIANGTFTTEKFKNAALIETMEKAHITSDLAGLPQKSDSYEAAIEYCEKWIQSESVIIKKVESDDCTFFSGMVGGLPTGGTLCNLFAVGKAGSPLGEGTVIRLPIPQINDAGGTREPDSVSFSEDGTKLVYTYTFDTAAYHFGLEHIRREAGTFTYTVDLTSGITAVSYTK